MANPSEAAVVARLLAAPYAANLQALAAEGHETSLQAGLEALEAYEEMPAVFAPYSSRFDAVLRGTASLTPLEARGRRAFEDPARGNCAVCHPSEPDTRGVPPVFSDFGYAALGLPRNPDIPANADPRHFDLGLCGPYRTTLADHLETCGEFRTPSLRNVATRRVFFHNGVVHSLRDAVAFYATRDTQPGRWYPKAPDGGFLLFNDLPPADRANVETGLPFGRRPPAHAVFSDADVDAIVAFLMTLTDGDVRPAAIGRPR
jgi:cytochrome c peroxidase